MRRRQPLAALLLVGALAGCGSSAPTAEAAGELDRAAFAGSGSSIDGDDVALSAFADRDLVVWFWSPW
jgi:hypothetical protein